jgi:hypothetical protein
VEVVLYSTLPIFHLHTFLFLSFLLGSWVFLRCRKEVLTVIALSLIPASILVWLLTGGFKSGQMIHLKLGWMQDQEHAYDETYKNILFFWFHNFGALPFVVAGLCVWLGIKKDWKHAAFVVPAIVIFLVCCVVMFAPWEWDNTKLMIWSYLTVLPAMWLMLKELRIPIRAGVCVALYFSGFVSLLGGIDNTHRGYPLANRKELDYLNAIIASAPPNAVFAGHPTYNHPLLLTGNKVVAGYDGHLLSHGIDYRPTFDLLKDLLNGAPQWKEDARKLNVDFLYWGKEEQEHYPDSKQPWKDRFPVFAQDDMAIVYDLRALKMERPK